MPSAGNGSNGGVPSGRRARVQEAVLRLGSAETVPAERRRQATIENLTGALAESRRGASALRAENDQLRAEVVRFRQAQRDNPSSGEAALRDAAKLVEIALPANERAPGAVRTVIGQCLAGLVTPEVLGDIQLLATELVTNSVRHGELSDGDAAIVRVYLVDEAVRVDVENPGTAGVVASNGADPRTGRGFGLQLVGDLAARWGIRRDQNTHVWFEMGRRSDMVTDPALDAYAARVRAEGDDLSSLAAGLNLRLGKLIEFLVGVRDRRNMGRNAGERREDDWSRHCRSGGA